MRRLLALSMIALAAACGGDDDPGTTAAAPTSTPTTSATASATPTAAGPAGPEELRALTGDRWSLTQVVLSVGDQLKVTNADPEKGHDVSVEGVGASDTLAQGESFTLTFKKAGTYTLVCTIHPGMDATVTVR